MKTVVKGAIRNEKGNVLILVLILLVVGGLILTPLLGLMSTGLLAGQVYEKKMDEYYAADAGVEDAIWKIMHPDSIPSDSWKPCDDRPDWDVYEYPKTLSVGNKSVEVVVYRKDWDLRTCGENITYQVLSTAVTDDSSGTAAIDSSSTVESYVDAEFVVMNLLDNAITSQGDIDLGSNSVVNGKVQYGGELTGQGTVNGTKTPEEYVNWPDSIEVSNYYLSQVQNATDPGSPIEINGEAKNLTQSYRNGDLKIQNTPNNPGTLILQGTVYVNGNLDFKQPGNQGAYIVDLNGQTIFVTGNITFPAHFVTVSGSGCIIAIGNVDFQPGLEGSPSDFVFVMSIKGDIWFKPQGDFYGSLAGDVKVDLQPNCAMTWTPWEGRGINLPDFAYQSDVVKTVTIRTWEVNPQ